jgi:hypothetical protein
MSFKIQFAAQDLVVFARGEKPETGRVELEPLAKFHFERQHNLLCTSRLQTLKIRVKELFPE